MSTNTFFIQSGSIFFISGNLVPSQSISTSIDVAVEGDSGSLTTTILSSVFKPEAQSVSTLQLDPDDLGSFVMSGSNPSASFYMSSSGKMGFGTKNPKSAFDIRTDDFKVRSRDGSKEFLIDDKGRFKARKFKKTSKNDFEAVGTNLERTGSEIVMSYSPGTFEEPIKAQVGDIMGTIKWEDESFDSISGSSLATSMQIQGEIVASTVDGVAGQIIFSIANPDDLSGGPLETVRVASTETHITGGLNVSGLITANRLNVNQITSSIVSSSILFSSGSNILGDASTDTHTFIGSITSSGNISSSGQLIIGRTGSFTKIIINSDLSGASEPPFLISIPDTNGQNQKLQVNHQGTLRFGALDTLPTAITGGLVYSASGFYVGLP